MNDFCHAIQKNAELILKFLDQVLAVLISQMHIFISKKKVILPFFNIVISTHN